MTTLLDYSSSLLPIFHVLVTPPPHPIILQNFELKMNIESEKEKSNVSTIWERISKKLFTLGVETRGERHPIMLTIRYYTHNY